MKIETLLKTKDAHHADLCYAGLRDADLEGADLNHANLYAANLVGANLEGANLDSANLYAANLVGANLVGANLYAANLDSANLYAANLYAANLYAANLYAANLSQTQGLLSASKWMQNNFQRYGDGGYIVFKALGDTSFKSPAHWLSSGAGGVLEERGVNPDRCADCGSGVSFGTLEWVRKIYPKQEIWACHLAAEDLPDTVVPYNTDGKARCAKLRKLRLIKPNQED